MENTTPTARKKPGPQKGPPTVKSTVLLPPHLHAWAIAKPGGLTWVARDLMQKAYEAEHVPPVKPINRGYSPDQADVWGRAQGLPEADRRLLRLAAGEEGGGEISAEEQDTMSALWKRFQAGQ